MCWCLCTEVQGQRAKVRAETSSHGSKLLCFPGPSIPHLCPSSPPLSAILPCLVRAKCPHCHRAHISAVVPSIPGAIPPRTPRQSPFCRGQSRAGWGQAGTCPPEYQSGGEACLPWQLGRSAGSACCETPPHQPGGQGGGSGGPQEQRVSVARDSSKETRGDKCATNRWGGYLGKGTARQAGSQPLPRRLAGGEGLGPAPPASGAARGAAVGPSRGRFASLRAQ